MLRAIASVGTSDADPSAAPQLRQKRLRSGISAEQDGHLAIETHSITREAGCGLLDASSPVSRRTRKQSRVAKLACENAADNGKYRKPRCRPEQTAKGGSFLLAGYR